jgi:hypothetical protein
MGHIIFRCGKNELIGKDFCLQLNPPASNCRFRWGSGRFVCVCVCVYVCMNVRIYVCMYEFMYMYFQSLSEP